MKKNKKKKKKLIEIEKIPQTKISIITKRILLIILLLIVVCHLISCFSIGFITFLWKYVTSPVQALLYYLSQHIILKIGGFRIGLFFYIGFLIALISIINQIIWNSKKLSKEKRIQLVNLGDSISYVAFSIIVVLLLGVAFMNFNNPKLDTMYFPEEQDNEYTEEDLWKLNDYLEKQTISYAHKMDRDENGKIVHEKLEDLAIGDLKKASLKYDVLKGVYPRKLYAFDDYDRSHDPSTTGLTTIDSVGVSYYTEAPELLNTITHELCHTRGISRENEATLCSIIVGLESDNKLSKYAAYMEAYGRSIDAVSLIDEERSRKSMNNFTKLCTDYGYDEVCNYSMKDTDLYVKKSDKFVIKTFETKYYDKEYLISFIHSFDKYNVQLFIGEKEIKISDIDSYWGQDDVRFEISFDNSKKIFSEVKGLLEEKKEKFFSIYQEYPDMYVGVDFEKDEAIKYYTSGIPNSNIITFVTKNKEISELFDYSRVVRLVLEYFDHENIGY